MTDNEIIKALECCGFDEDMCLDCPIQCDCEKDTEAMVDRAKAILNLINRQQEEIENLEYKLTGVMHFVDKWLDGAELEQDEVNRASAMREKTLQIVEQQQAEIERLSKEVDRLSQCVLYHDGQVADAIKDVLDKLEKKIYPYGMVNDGNYGINALSIKMVIEKIRIEMVGEG